MCPTGLGLLGIMVDNLTQTDHLCAWQAEEFASGAQVAWHRLCIYERVIVSSPGTNVHSRSLMSPYDLVGFGVYLIVHDFFRIHRETIVTVGETIREGSCKTGVRPQDHSKIVS